MTKENAIAEAKKIAEQQDIPMVVVHAPLEHAEDESGPYGYCPLSAAAILYNSALKGIGQKDDPAQGIIAQF